jgi:hypothetical protein
MHCSMGVWTTFPLYTYLPTVHVYVNQKKGVKNNYCRGLTKGFYHCGIVLYIVSNIALSGYSHTYIYIDSFSSLGSAM